jgi:hypothetical protein
VNARLVEVFDLLEQVVGKTEVGVKADLAARIALNDRLPYFKGLFIFPNLKTSIARLKKLSGRAIFDDRAALDGLGRLSKEREGEEEREESIDEVAHVT